MEVVFQWFMSSNVVILWYLKRDCVWI
jgi:hypothetical protein